VVIWGNGGCYADGGTAYQRFLWQVASYGVMFISPGTILGESNRGRTNATWMTGAIDWITKAAGKGNYTHVDPSRIATWGQSCGGTEALANAQDPRISSVGVFDSGSRTEADSKAIVGKISKPVFYFIGGVSDSAYPNVSLTTGSRATQFRLTPTIRLNATIFHFQQRHQLGRGTTTEVI